MKKTLTLLIAVMLLIAASGITTFGQLANFKLMPYRNGSSVYTNAVKKDDTYTAVANITPQHYTTYLGSVYMRVRTNDGVAAGSLIEASTYGKQYLPYWAGYNTVGSYRRLYCNYVSNNEYYGGVTVEGRWDP